MQDLSRLLKNKDFESEEQLIEFMNSMVGKKIPEFDQGTLSDEEKASNMVMDAYDFPKVKGKSMIERALKLDSNCLEAFEYLASQEESLEIAVVFYEKAVQIGRDKFGGEYLKVNKGHFWGMTETRPFMRSLQMLADCYYELGKVFGAISLYEELIKLNPNDNQGVRDQLLLYLIETNQPDKFNKYAKKYVSDRMAFMAYNRLLFSLLIGEEQETSKKLLLLAKQSNPHVPQLLLSNRMPSNFPNSYAIGDKNEAFYYVYFAYPIWRKIPVALTFLKQNA